MKWRAAESGDFQRPDPGTYPGRCVRIVDIGTQHGEYQGKPTARRQCIISWELPDELIPEGESAGQPYLVSKYYTQSLSDKANLRQDLTSWRGRDFTPEELEGFDPKNILGKPCLVTLVGTPTARVKVSGVASVPKGMVVKPQFNPSIFFSLEPDEFDSAALGMLSDWCRETITKCPEYRALMNGGSSEASAPHDGPDIPF